jgi:hypothetical protein
MRGTVTIQQCQSPDSLLDSKEHKSSQTRILNPRSFGPQRTEGMACPGEKEVVEMRNAIICHDRALVRHMHER